jgi:hypothetical protein
MVALAALVILRWVEQENSRKLKAESQKQKGRCKLQAESRKLLNTGVIVKEGIVNRNLLLLFMLKFKDYYDKQ